jgi:hypothetical protein
MTFVAFANRHHESEANARSWRAAAIVATLGNVVLLALVVTL